MSDIFNSPPRIYTDAQGVLLAKFGFSLSVESSSDQKENQQAVDITEWGKPTAHFLLQGNVGYKREWSTMHAQVLPWNEALKSKNKFTASVLGCFLFYHITNHAYHSRKQEYSWPTFLHLLQLTKHWKPTNDFWKFALCICSHRSMQEKSRSKGKIRVKRHVIQQ